MRRRVRKSGDWPSWHRPLSGRLVVLNWYDLSWRSDKNMTPPLSLLCWESCVLSFSSGLRLYCWDYEWWCCCVKVSWSVFLRKCAFCNTPRLFRKRRHKLLFYCHKARCVYGRVYLHLCSHSFISSLLKIKCKCYWIKEQTFAAGLYGRVNECVPNTDCCSDLILCRFDVLCCRQWDDVCLSAGERSVCAHVTFWPSLVENTVGSHDRTPLSSPSGPVAQVRLRSPKKVWQLVARQLLIFLISFCE